MSQCTLPMEPDAPLMKAVRAVREEATRFSASFTVLGIPVAQPRPKASIVQPKGCRARIHVTAAQREHPVHQWTACLYEGCERERPAAPLQGPVGVRLRFHLRAPDALIRNPRGGGGPKLATPWPCKARTDLDNLAKPVLDVLTNLGWWGDDGQIVDLSATKVYAQPGQASRVDVTVWEVG